MEQRHNPELNLNSNGASGAIKASNSWSAKQLMIEVPRFNDIDPQDWIFKIQRFFDYHKINEEEILKLSSLYFDGEALAWFQWRFKNTTITSWSNFLQSPLIRFGPYELEEYQGQLAKLVQT